MEYINITFKRILLLLSFCLCTLISQAEIQRKFSSFELSKTSKTEFKKFLEQEDYPYSPLAGGIMLQNVNFDGRKWDGLGLLFWNDKLYDARFMTLSNPNLKGFYEEVLGDLKEKYKDYFQPDESTDNRGVFIDDNTIMFIEYFEHPQNVVLVFQDKDYMNK